MNSQSTQAIPVASAVTIRCQIAGRTDEAILINDGKKLVWIPLSQVAEEIQEPFGNFGLMQTTAIVVPQWLAKEKELESPHKDTSTVDMFGDEQ
jgi:hypothetical protein